MRTARPTLVAVSKTKPAQLVADCYAAGQRHFGENYVQELCDKGADPLIVGACPDIRWHLIGHLQTNKVNKVLATPGLYMIESIDSERLATAVSAAWLRLHGGAAVEPLRVLVQVNTSGEEAKSGCAPADAVRLCRHVRDQCAGLRFEGLMTIGAYGHDYAAGPNLDLVRLMELHGRVCEELAANADEVQVSMGMSADYEHAIGLGSSMVRVGTSIFGYRPPKGAE